MQMRQYVYFAIDSGTVAVAEITAALGIAPDQVSVRGSKSMSPRPVPITHSWQIRCANTAQRIDDQAAEVLERISPAATAVRRLVDDRGVAATLVFVRYFNDEDGVDESLEPSIGPGGLVLEHIGRQHQLLGWALEPEQLNLLASMRAAISADEYG